MTTQDPMRLNAHKENPRIEAHPEEKLIEAHHDEITAAAATNPIFTNSAKGNIPPIMKWGIAVMLIMAILSGVAVYFGLKQHYRNESSGDLSAWYCPPGGNFVLEGSFAEQFEPLSSDFQPQAASTYLLGSDTATAIETDGHTTLLAVSDPSTRLVYLFETDGTAIFENATLNEFAKRLTNSGEAVTIIAYTDPTGSTAHNRDLSARRAKALGTYLTNHGVDNDKISTIGRGSTSAFGSNALDRRAELHF